MSDRRPFHGIRRDLDEIFPEPVFHSRGGQGDTILGYRSTYETQLAALSMVGHHSDGQDLGFVSAAKFGQSVGHLLAVQSGGEK
ncbi:MAG: hypothetical protein H5U08_06910 [Thermogutta sp.]|uniref:hypothetical protein n=1 Tax=Thermogutta sp. TaxID=1962930 RepID=UPI00199F5205|nr:hypothetical protein [Thermogutta sp.]MBC7352071.1 hypothetical protein [Thermogutta sp.]